MFASGAILHLVNKVDVNIDVHADMDFLNGEGVGRATRNRGTLVERSLNALVLLSR